MRRLSSILLILVVNVPALLAQESIRVGSATLTQDSGSRVPVGAALFAYKNATNVLVSEAAVAGTEPIRSGQIFVDETGPRTGIALANPGAAAAAITLILRNAAGSEAARQTLTLQGGEQIARYVAQLFPDDASGLTSFIGTMTFESDQPIAAVTLRESRNAQDEPLYSTLPVVDVNAPASGAPAVFPHIAIGDGYSTEIILINPTVDALDGRVDLLNSDGNPLLPSFAYHLAPHGAYRASLQSAAALATGFATVTPTAGRTPAGAAIFQYKVGGTLKTEAGVEAVPATTASRLYVDYIGTQTGFAVSNNGGLAADLTITLMDRYGFTESVQQKTLAARSHLSLLVHELFPSVSPGYSGLLEIRSSAPVASVALKVTVNTRNDFVLTTLPVADLYRPYSGPVVFPQVALGLGFSTRLILINPDVKASTGSLVFRNSDGSAMNLPLSGQITLPAGAGRQLHPGDNARAASLLLIDPSTNQPTREFVMNEGSIVRPRVAVFDSSNSQRDDFDVDAVSLDSETAFVDASGRVQGRKAGFATLTLNSGAAVTTVTATVVKVGVGAGGFETAGIAQDTARRLYLASPSDHSILRALDPNQTPQIYAGVRGSPGLKDDARLAALFRNPSFLVLNQGDGSLYVSDETNHVIRRVGGGASGKVEILAGSGSPGSADGAARSAAFTRPQGIALDNRGYLWIADSGNHTIRRMSLITGQVVTIAGQAGVSGLTDGRGVAARFNSPAGLAVEVESAVEQLDRQRRGLPPPPTRVLVADSGNGVIRRVSENGDVETLRPPTTGGSAATVVDSPPLTFSSPSGIAIDPNGNIFVTEPTAARVRVILKTGDVVAAAQSGTFAGPKGVAVTQSGRVIVSGQQRAATELIYGTPQIGNVTPNRLNNRGGQSVTISGANFSPDTLLVVSGVVISNRTVRDTRTITFVAPALPSGRSTVSVENRGGIGQASITVDAVALKDLPAGYITTVAGGGTFAGEGTPARSVSIQPFGVTVDNAGNVYIADTLNRKIRRVDARTGTIISIAGSGQNGSTDEEGPAIAARLSDPTGIALDPQGNVLIAGRMIRKIDMATGLIKNVAGGHYGSCGDGGDALQACFTLPLGLATDAAGNIYIADVYDHRVRRVDAKTNIITTVAGTGEQGFSGDGGNGSTARLNYPGGVAVDNVRNVLYIADGDNNRIRLLDLATGIITTVAGDGTTTPLSQPNALALDSTGNVYISDRNNSRIRMLDVTTGLMTTIAGGGSYAPPVDDELATSTTVRDTFGVAVDGAGNVLFAELYTGDVRRIDANTKRVSRIAGTGQSPEIENNVPATATALKDPVSVSFDRSGNLLILERGSGRIRRVDAAGIMTTIAGGGDPPEAAGDGGLATNAALSTPQGKVVVDAAGNIYVADSYNYRVRKIDAATGIISAFAVKDGMRPDDVALDHQGNLYIADGANHRIYKMNLSTRNLVTVAGGGIPDSGLKENIPALTAILGESLRLAVDNSDNLLIVDTDNQRVRKFEPGTQTISTVAGGGSTYEDGLIATSVLMLPLAVEVDSAGNLFIVDFGYPLGIRKVSKDTGIVTSIIGTESVFPELGDNGPAKKAFLYYPLDIALDSAGNLFIADTANGRIRAVRVVQ